MPHYCCVPYCCSNGYKEKISFHQIPSDSDRRHLWLKAISRKGPTKDSPWVPNQYDVVCQKHFKVDDYTKGLKKLCLKKGAVPSTFPGYPTYLQPPTKKAKRSLIRALPEIQPSSLSQSNNVPHVLQLPTTLEIENEENQHFVPAPSLPSIHNILHPAISHLEPTPTKKAKRSLKRAFPEIQPSSLSQSNNVPHVLQLPTTLEIENEENQHFVKAASLPSTQNILHPAISHLEPTKKAGSSLIRAFPEIQPSSLARSSNVPHVLQLPTALEIENEENQHFVPVPSLPSTQNILHPAISPLENPNSVLKRKVRTLISSLSRARIKIKKLKEQKKAEMEKNIDLVKKFEEFLDAEKDANDGCDHAMFIMDQMKSRKKKLFRWSPEVIKICTLWHKCSPAGYRYIQNSKFLNLPCRTTLKKYVG